MSKRNLIITLLLIVSVISGTMIVGASGSAPIAANLSFSAEMNKNLAVNALDGLLANAVDPENDALSLVKVNDVSHGTVLLTQDGAFHYIPGLDFVGTDSFDYQVNDGSNVSNIATVTITVLEPEVVEISANLNSFGANFSWSPPQSFGELSESTRYQLTILDQTDNVIYETTVGTNAICNSANCDFSIDGASLPYDISSGLYRWRITGLDSDGPNWSQEEVLQAAPPNVPAINTLVNNGTANILWQHDYSATWTQFYVRNAAGDTVYLEWLENASLCVGSTCGLSLTNLPAGEYSAYALAYGPGGMSIGGVEGWNGPFNFTVETMSVPSSIQNLSVISEDKTIVSWSSADGATSYQVWIGTLDPATTAFMGWIEADSLNCEGSLCSLTTDLPAGSYHWYVRAFGPDSVAEDALEGWVEGTAFSVQ